MVPLPKRVAAEILGAALAGITYNWLGAEAGREAYAPVVGESKA